MKINGTVPDDLHQWCQERIEQLTYYSWSHLIEVALRRLREEEEVKKTGSGHEKGGRGT